jgi:hypothetical protein
MKNVNREGAVLDRTTNIAFARLLPALCLARQHEPFLLAADRQHRSDKPSS